MGVDSTESGLSYTIGVSPVSRDNAVQLLRRYGASDTNLCLWIQFTTRISATNLIDVLVMAHDAGIRNVLVSLPDTHEGAKGVLALPINLEQRAFDSDTGQRFRAGFHTNSIAW